MNGDMLSMAYKMAKEYGMSETLKIFLNMVPESPLLVAVQEGFTDVVRGDHLVYKTAMGWNVHFYVVDNLGGGSLKVCGCFLENDDNLLIETELIFKPAQAQQIRMEERVFCEADLAEKLKKKVYKETSILHNEKCRMDVFKKERNYYDFLCNNSEHFVNFIKTGEATCQVALDIECFIKKHIFVQIIQTESVKIVIPDGSWATLVGALCDIILKNSDVQQSTQNILMENLTEVSEASANQAYNEKERPKDATIQTTKRSATKETVAKANMIQATKKESRVTVASAARTRKSAGKGSVKVGGKATTGRGVANEIVKVGEMTTAAQTRKSVSKESVKVGGKATTVRAGRGITNEVTKVGGMAAAARPTKFTSATKRDVRDRCKTTTVQAIKGASVRVMREREKATMSQAKKSVLNNAAKEVEKERRKSATNEAIATGDNLTMKIGKSITVQTGKPITVQATKSAGVAKDVLRKRGKGKPTAVLQAKKGAANNTLKEVRKAMVQPSKSSPKKVQKEGEANNKQETDSVAEAIVKEGEKATTDQEAVGEIVDEGKNLPTDQVTNSMPEDVEMKEGEKAATVQATNSVVEETVKEKVTADQTMGETTMKGNKEVTTIQPTNSLSDDVAKEGGRATAVQASKSVTVVAMQGVSKEALKHGSKHTTTHVVKNTATHAIKHTANATVVAGLVIEGAIYSANMGKAIYNYSKGEMDDEEFIDYAVEQTATSGGSTAGGISGSLAGIAAGAAIGSVIPVIGTIIGGTIGGFAGGISGGIGGTLLGKEIGKLINFERKKMANETDHQMNPE